MKKVSVPFNGLDLMSPFVVTPTVTTKNPYAYLPVPDEVKVPQNKKRNGVFIRHDVLKGVSSNYTPGIRPDGL